MERRKIEIEGGARNHTENVNRRQVEGGVAYVSGCINNVMASCHSNERGGAGNAAVACDLLPQTYTSTFVSDSDLSVAVHSASRPLRILTQ